MFRKMYVIPKNDPASVTCETLPQYTIPSFDDLPKNSIMVIKKTFPDTLFAQIPGYEKTTEIETIAMENRFNVMRIINEGYKYPELHDCFTTKTLRNFITEKMERLVWDEPTKNGGRVVYSYDFEHGFYDEDFEDSNGETIKHIFYSPTGKRTVSKFENGQMIETYKVDC